LYKNCNRCATRKANSTRENTLLGCEHHKKNEYSKATGYNPHGKNKSPGQVHDCIPQRSTIAFNVVLYLLQTDGVKPELNKASSVTSILSSPHFLTGNGTHNHSDELYSNPLGVCAMYQISDNRSHKAPLVVQATSGA
jgi:hypothetical protein